MFTALLLLQSISAPAPTPAEPPARPCRLKGPRGKLIDVDPKLCEQSTWSNVRLPAMNAPHARSTVMDIDVNDEGRVDNCRIRESSGSKALDEKACSITVEKARYTPAIDGKGKPMRTTTRLKVDWPAN